MIKRTDGVTSETVDDQAVLIAPSGEEIITLNEVGTVIWGALEQPSDVDALAAQVLAAFPDAPVGEVRQDVVDFVAELREAGLVEGDVAPS